MEIKFEKDIELQTGNIVGIIDEDRFFYSYLENLVFEHPNIVVDSKKLNKTETRKFRKKISFVENYILNDFLNLTVYEYMKFRIMDQYLSIKDYPKKIRDSLKIVGYGEEYLDQKISLLSFSEQKFILFAIAFLSNPDILVFDHFFEGLDMLSIKKLMRVLTQLSEQYHKTFLIRSLSVDSIYTLTKKVLIFKDKEFFIGGDTLEVFDDYLEILMNHGIPIPKAVKFSYLVNHKKKVKLGSFRDVRDLIKDIYKKVT